MTYTTTWHADDDVLALYAAGRVNDVVASSIEAHLVACPTCRDGVAAHVPPARLEANRAGVMAALDAPRPGWLERLLVRLGVGPANARLLAATPTLRASWTASIAVALAFAAVAAANDGALGFLVLAPLVPVVGVAVAFSSSLDDSAEIVDATPSAGLRLLLLRTLAALGPGIVLAGAAGFLVDDLGRSWALWLLPALAMSGLTIVASASVPMATAATALGVVWAGGVVVTEATARGSLAALRAGGEAQSVLFQAPGQLAAAAVIALAGTALALRLQRGVQPATGRYL